MEVSLPCWEIFDAQDQIYRLSVIPDDIFTMSFEAMSTLGWERYSHTQFGLDRFGASKPYKEVYAVKFCLSHAFLVSSNANSFTEI